MDSGGSQELISTSKLGEGSLLLDLVSPGDELSVEDIPLDDDNDDIITSLLRNSHDSKNSLNLGSEDENGIEKIAEDDPMIEEEMEGDGERRDAMEIDEIVDEDDLLLTSSNVLVKDWKSDKDADRVKAADNASERESPSRKRKEREASSDSLEEVDDDAEDTRRRGPKKQRTIKDLFARSERRRTSEEFQEREAKRRKSDDLLSLINDDDFISDDEKTKIRSARVMGEGKVSAPIDLVDSSGEDFQGNVHNFRQSASSALRRYREQHGIDIEDDEEENEKEKGKKRGRKKRKMEDEYSDQEDTEDIVYKPLHAKTKLKVNKSSEGPKFDISEKGDTEVGDLILTPEGVTPVIPAVVNAKLRQYQRDGVKFLYKNYAANQGAILGDEMGLGKTIQAVVFLLAVIPVNLKPSRTLFGPLHVAAEEKAKAAVRDGSAEGVAADATAAPTIPEHQRKPVLICAPASVLQNWSREITTWTRLAGRNLKVISYVGDKRKTHLKAIETAAVNIVLTTYETFRIDFLEGVFNSVEWNCCVFDEIHKIKGRKAKVTVAANAINTRRRFGLTGTVMQNNFEELYTLLDFVRPGRLGSITYFTAKYINPIKNGQKRDATPREIADAKFATKHLNGTIKKIVLRRDKSVINDLLKGKDDHVVFCTMTTLQLNVYRRVLESDEYRILASVQEPCKCGSGYKSLKCCLAEDKSSFNWRRKIFPAIQNLQKLSQHPSLLNPKYDNDKDLSEEELREREAFLRRAFGEDTELIDSLLKEGKDEELSGKIRTLMKLLPIWKEKGHKALLFSYSTRTLDILQRIIRKHGLTFSRIDGTVPPAQRQSIIDRFNESDNDTQFLMLISTKAGGLGLNITSANIVIVFDASWNVTHDLQAQDRAYRIGQTKHTDVYRLISVGTIEELIYQRQVYKQQMANIGVHGFDERRYFKGVHGVKGEEGELFGLTNLLKLNTDTILSKELVERVELAEKEAQELYQIEKSKLEPRNDEKDSELATIFDKNVEKPSESTQVIDLEDPNPPKPLASQSQLVNPSKPIDPLTQAMLAAGVVYMHKNQAIIGDNEIEKQRAMKAAEMYRKELEAKARAEDLDSPVLSSELKSQPVRSQLSADNLKRLQELRFHYYSQLDKAGASNGQVQRLTPLIRPTPATSQHYIPNTASRVQNPFFLQQQLHALNSQHTPAAMQYNLDQIIMNRSQLIDPQSSQSLSQINASLNDPNRRTALLSQLPPAYRSSQPVGLSSIPSQNALAHGTRPATASQPAPVPLRTFTSDRATLIDITSSPPPVDKSSLPPNIGPATLAAADLPSVQTLGDVNALGNRVNNLTQLSQRQLSQSAPTATRNSNLGPFAHPRPLNPQLNRNTAATQFPRPPARLPGEATVITIDDD